MKKTTIAIMLLISGLVVTPNIQKISFAEKTTEKAELVQDIAEEETTEKVEPEQNTAKEETTEKVEPEQDIAKEETTEKVEPEQDIAKEETTEKVEPEQDTAKEETTEAVQELTQQEAKALLEKMNPGIEYLYQGTEANFEAIQQKGYKGYVFLPNVDTDLGMFVNKETKQVYYFHPSGYFELVK